MIKLNAFREYGETNCADWNLPEEQNLDRTYVFLPPGFAACAFARRGWEVFLVGSPRQGPSGR